MRGCYELAPRLLMSRCAALAVRDSWSTTIQTQAPQSKTPLLDLLNARPGETLGAGLLRLAHLAAAAHRYEAVTALAGGANQKQNKGETTR